MDILYGCIDNDSLLYVVDCERKKTDEVSDLFRDIGISDEMSLLVIVV